MKEVGKEVTPAEHNKSASLLIIPAGVLLQVFSFFNKKDLARTALTCKKLAALSKNPILQNLPWPPCHYGLPPLQETKAVQFRGGFLGVLKADLFAVSHQAKFELLPRTYFGITVISNGSALQLQLWNLRTCEQIVTTIHVGENTHFFGINLLGFSENCVCISEASLDRSHSTIRLWNIFRGECLQKIELDGAVTAIVKISEQVFASATSTTIHIWDLENGKCIKTIDTRGVEINVLLAVPEKNILISGEKGRNLQNTVKLWNINTGELIRGFHDKHIEDLTFLSEDFLVSLSAHVIQVWDIDNLKCVMTFEDERSATNKIHLNKLTVLSPQYIAIGGSDNSIVILDIENKKCVHRLGGTSLSKYSPQEFAIPLRLPNGDLVAYYSQGDYERSIRIWRFPELQLENNKTKDSEAAPIKQCNLQ